MYGVPGGHIQNFLRNAIFNQHQSDVREKKKSH